MSKKYTVLFTVEKVYEFSVTTDKSIDELFDYYLEEDEMIEDSEKLKKLMEDGIAKPTLGALEIACESLEIFGDGNEHRLF